jgi:BirA family biotin operon repressor/biotin-[acetyl-CoA-carboxylase] ligase
MSAATPFIDWQVSLLSHVPSTQDAVRDLAAAGAPEGTVVQALMQTAGRGRQGNQWTSPMGNLYMSILLRPDCTAMAAGQISFVAAVALSAAMDEVIAPGHVKTLKWPNDILIDGRKCAGILLESDLDKNGRVNSLILGMGVNVMAPPEDRVGLMQVGKGQIPIHPFRDKILSHLAAYYGHWRKDGFAEIRETWLQQAHGLGQPVTARLKDRHYTGVFKDIDKDGALRMELDDHKILDISAGEVYFPA